MNKTVNINLGGMFFHVDEDAYQKLTRYFDAIRRSLSNSTGQEEIIKDIEMRVAELFAEKHTSDNQVITIREVDEVIAVMGQPEDYRIEDDQPGAGPSQQYSYGSKRNKKLYRDTEKGMLGGVATGLGHYFGFDAVWLKIMFVIFVFAGFGTGIIAYIVLWIVTPAAETTSEKLEMTGEPVTISNIERKVREEFDNVSARFKSANYDEMGRHVKSGADKFVSNIGEVLMTMFKVFAKVLGAIIMVIAALLLVSLVIGLFTFGSTSLFNLDLQNYIEAFNYTDFPIWIICVLGFLALGIPFFFLFILGLKLLVNNLKSIGSIAKYTLLAVWLISVAILITFGVKQATELAFDSKSVTKETLALTANDTLEVKFRFDDYYASEIKDHEDFIFTKDSSNVGQIYSNEVELVVMSTDEKLPYIQIEKKANGKSLYEAKSRAAKINYGYKIEGNKLILDNFLLTETENKYRNQEVKIILYLPVGTYFKPDSSVQDFDRSDDEFFNLHFSGDYLYRVEKNKVLCLDCPANENEFNDVLNGTQTSGDSVTATITVNKDGINIVDGKDQIKVSKDGLYINEDGVVTKKQ